MQVLYFQLIIMPQQFYEQLCRVHILRSCVDLIIEKIKWLYTYIKYIKLFFNILWFAKYLQILNVKSLGSFQNTPFISFWCQPLSSWMAKI